MSRTAGQFNCRNPQDSEIVIQKILASRGYRKIEQYNETFYQNGDSLFTPPKCIKYTFNGEVLVLEGWVVPFNMGSESELNGILCSASKKACRNVLEEIKHHLNITPIENSDGGFITSADEDSQNHYVELAIGIVLALISPLLGFIASVYFFIRKYENSNKHGLIVVAVAFANFALSMVCRAFGII